MKRDPLRVGLVGAGRIGVTAHLPAWRAESRAAVTAIVDTREGWVRKTAGDWGIDRWSSRLEDVLDDVDVVDICTPALAHIEPMLMALKAGKHVLIEKPVAPTMEAFDQLAEAARSADVVTMVAENWPYSSAARRAQTIVSRGDLGEVFLVHARHESGLRLEGPVGTYDIDRSMLGYLFSAGIHVINMSRHLFGEFASVSAYSTTRTPPVGFDLPSEDDLIVASSFASGALGSFYFTGRARQVGERHLEFRVFGTKATLDFDVLRGFTDLTTAKKQEVSTDGRASLGYVEEVGHFVDVILNGGKPETSLEDHRRTLLTVRAIYHSAMSGAAVDV